MWLVTGIPFAVKWLPCHTSAEYLNISANKVAFCPMFDCLSQQLYIKTTCRIFTKILPKIHLWTRKIPSNSGSHLCLFRNFLEGIFNAARWGILPQLRSYLSKNYSDLHENFTRDVSLDNKVPLNLGSYLGYPSAHLQSCNKRHLTSSLYTWTRLLIQRRHEVNWSKCWSQSPPKWLAPLHSAQWNNVPAISEKMAAVCVKTPTSKCQ